MRPAVTESPAVVTDAARAHRARTGTAGARSFLIGLLGRGIAGSRSPYMHEQEARRVGVACTYALLDFDDAGLADDDLGRVLDATEASGFAGLNVTHPFKQAIVGHLTDLAPPASAVGAVNTVVFQKGRRIGHNTDAWGFAESLRRHLPQAGRERVVLFGAGGAGAAVGHALLEWGTRRLDIVDANAARAVELAERLTRGFERPVTAVQEVDAVLRHASGAVNATPIGMDKYPGVPFDPALLEPEQWVADIVYFPAETELLRRARMRGCRVLPGTGMAVFQAVKAFELFTGMAADPEAMLRHFEASQ